MLMHTFTQDCEERVCYTLTTIIMTERIQSMRAKELTYLRQCLFFFVNKNRGLLGYASPRTGHQSWTGSANSCGCPPTDSCQQRDSNLGELDEVSEPYQLSQSSVGYLRQCHNAKDFQIFLTILSRIFILFYNFMETCFESCAQR